MGQANDTMSAINRHGRVVLEGHSGAAVSPTSPRMPTQKHTGDSQHGVSHAGPGWQRRADAALEDLHADADLAFEALDLQDPLRIFAANVAGPPPISGNRGCLPDLAAMARSLADFERPAAGQAVLDKASVHTVLADMTQDATDSEKVDAACGKRISPMSGRFALCWQCAFSDSRFCQGRCSFNQSMASRHWSIEPLHEPLTASILVHDELQC